VLGLSAKIYSRVFGLAATLNPRVIFIILIIILNLHDSNLISLIESSCNSGPKSLGCEPLESNGALQINCKFQLLIPKPVPKACLL
jgi:hypothetical protein